MLRRTTVVPESRETYSCSSGSRLWREGSLNGVLPSPSSRLKSILVNHGQQMTHGLSQATHSFVGIPMPGCPTTIGKTYTPNRFKHSITAAFSIGLQFFWYCLIIDVRLRACLRDQLHVLLLQRLRYAVSLPFPS